MAAKNYAYSYDNYAYEEKPDRKFKPRRANTKNYKVIRRQVFFALIIGLLCYFCNVVLSEFYVTNTTTLVKLKKQEDALLESTQSLKLDVDKLRSPGRITGIASSKLGMNTARSNIYVQKDNTKIAYNGYAYAHK